MVGTLCGEAFLVESTDQTQANGKQFGNSEISLDVAKKRHMD
jgi:ribosomal protein L31